MKLTDFVKKAIKKGPGYYAWTDYSKYYRTLPLNDRLVWFESKHGDDLGGNILWLLKEMSDNPLFADYKVCLTYAYGKGRKLAALLRKYDIRNVELICRGSRAYYRVAASAKYLFNDTSFNPFFMKKEGQVYLNTWHGTPFKCMGRKDSGGYWSLGNIQRNFIMADYLLYPSEYMKDHMLKDYMLENICSARTVMCGYPRNAAMLKLSRKSTNTLAQKGYCKPRPSEEPEDDITDMDEEMQQALLARKQEEEEKFASKPSRVYAYIPTWRSYADKRIQARSKAAMMHHLIELDDELNDDEVCLLKIHPLMKDTVDFAAFRHIRRFPADLDLYDVLSQSDALITDYSSVFYDYAALHRKIVLFAYDEEEYLEGRGLYVGMDEFPFPRLKEARLVAEELRKPVNYDDTAFLKKYCAFDREDAAEALLKLVLLQEAGDLQTDPIKGNGRENVLFYTGNLAKNGITTAALSCLANIDTKSRNYIVCYPTNKLGNGKTNLLRLPEDVIYMPIVGKANMSIREKLIIAGFRKDLLPMWICDPVIDRVYKREERRLYNNIPFSNVVQYMGYEFKRMLFFNAFDANRTIFVHNNMVEELANKTNCHARTLKKCYSEYDNVAIVTEDIREATKKVSGPNPHIVTVNNTVDFDDIRRRGNLPLTFDPETKCRYTAEELEELLDNSDKVFLNVGRFSAEKGQRRLIDAFQRLWQEDPEIRLVIIGGYGALYNELNEYVRSLPCADRIILIRAVSNPHPIMKRCTWFALPSTHEGLGLVLLEASVHGLPVFATDIPGPSGFMQEQGGLLVEDSEEGVYQGLKKCLHGEVPPLHIDEAAYNKAGIEQFESLLGDD